MNSNQGQNWPTAYATRIGLGVCIEVGIFSTHAFYYKSFNNFVLELFPSPQNKNYGLLYYIYYKC